MDDLIIQMRSLNMSKDQFDKLAQALRLSDFVKFAKYQPGDADAADSFESIKQSIMIIEQSETVSPVQSGKSEGGLK